MQSSITEPAPLGPPPSTTENDAAIALAVAEAEAQQRHLWGRNVNYQPTPIPHAAAAAHDQGHHQLASSAPPVLPTHQPHHHHSHATVSPHPDEDEDEDDDETVESLSQEAARAMGRLPPGVRDSLRRMPSLEKGMVVNTANDEAIARAVAQSEQVASADAISIGRRFDRKIRRVLHRVKEGMVDEVSAIKEAFRPRVNTFNSFVENDDFLNGKQLLKKRLDLYTLAEFSVSGDGDCQFASLADQLYRTTGMAAVVRHTVVNYLRANPERFNQYVPDDYTEYCNSMDKRGTWGDHAAANVYGVVIHLLTSYKDTEWMEIKPQDGVKTQKSLWLSFLAELHYNSLYSRQDLTSRLQAEQELRMSYAGGGQDRAAEALKSSIGGATGTASSPAVESNGPPILDDSHHHCVLM